MESIESLKIELESILNIYINAKLFFQDAEYLYNPDTIDEKKIANDNFFIRRTRISAWRSTILELCKLYQKSKNEHFNLLSFLEKLLSDYDVLEWKQKLPRKRISSFIDKINAPEIKSIRDNLKTLRDNEIAHTDRNNEKENAKITVTFKDIKKLLIITEEIIQELKNTYLDTHQLFDISESEKAGEILMIINKFWKVRQQELIDEFKKYEK